MAIFDHAHPKIVDSTFSFPEFVPAFEKNNFIPFVHFRVSWPDWSHPFLTMPTQKNLNQLLKFVIMYQHAKNQLMNSIYSFFRYNHFWSPFTRLAHPKIFKSSFNLCETVPACKKSVSFISSFLRYILESRHQIDHTHFCPCLTKNFSVNF